jgi:hypothetical protein
VSGQGEGALADANERRDWRIYADFAQGLIAEARGPYVDEPLGVELDQTVYALDASTIDLCPSVFPWTRFRRTKAGIKLRTLLDLRGSIPVFLCVTDARYVTPGGDTPPESRTLKKGVTAPPFE